MVDTECENCDGGRLEITDTDSRNEWCEEIYQCNKCDKAYIHRTEFNQKGLVTSDTFEPIEVDE